MPQVMKPRIRHDSGRVARLDPEPPQVIRTQRPVRPVGRKHPLPGRRFGEAVQALPRGASRISAFVASQNQVRIAVRSTGDGVALFDPAVAATPRTVSGSDDKDVLGRVHTDALQDVDEVRSRRTPRRQGRGGAPAPLSRGAGAAAPGARRRRVGPVRPRPRLEGSGAPPAQARGWRSSSRSSPASSRAGASAPSRSCSARSRLWWCSATICSSMVPFATRR